ncbi:MAG: hypothetical protein WC752_00540 [Patescibacteria group bacterium]|jgi:hypothetical protein
MRLKNRLLLILIFLLSLTLFARLESDLTFSDPDSFYHARFTKIISEQGVVINFPWQTQTVLQDYFTDHHLLYHLILVPLARYFPGEIAVKIGSIIFSAFFIALLYWYFAKRKVKYAWAFIFLLLTIGPFVLRLSLPKATPLALILLLLGIYYVEEKKYLLLFLISFLYVWAHGGFLILFLAAVIFCTAKFVETKHASSLHSILVVLGGFLAGLVINPYFPNNLWFYWQQVVQIGIINYKDQIDVGAEWYAYSLPDLIGATSLMWIVSILGVLIFCIYLKKQKASSISWLILSVILFVATLRSRRFVEYFVPAMLIFSSLTISWFLNSMYWKKFIKEAKVWYERKKILSIILLIYLALAIPFSMGRTLLSLKKELKSGFPFDTFKGASEYLQKNTVPEDIIFHARWDDWPILFFHNQSNYYIVGLDATFMYKYNKERYILWDKIGSGQIKDNLAETIKNNFNCHYVFINNKEEDTRLFQAYLERDSGVKIIYEDDEATVYEII